MLSSARIRFACAVLLVVVFMTTFSLGSAQAQSGWKQIIVRCSPQDLEKIRAKIGAAIVDSYRGHYLLSVAASTKIDDVEGIQRNSISAADNKRVNIKRRRDANNNSGSTRFQTQNANYYGTLAPEIYTNQPAVSQISLPRALQAATGRGARISVVDTGIDLNHPVLRGVILPGKNYVGITGLPDEADDPVLSQAASEAFAVMQAHGEGFAVMQATVTTFTVSQAAGEAFAVMQAHGESFSVMQTADKVSKVLSAGPLFGHGTMMAGLIHLVAPDARIIPMKAFDASGSATEWNVIRAVLDSVDLGADVINMSFASSVRSKLLDDAMDYATARGVVLVGASGNDDTEAPTYPASEEEVVAVTAVDLSDQKASFANFGTYVDLSSPGVDLITTFPGMFARTSGTSGSAALVSGVLGLIKQRGTRGLNPRQVVEQSADEIDTPGRYRNKLGKGRINAARAVR